MNTVHAIKYGILPGKEITEGLAALTAALADIGGDKTVVFEKGTYYIDSEKCEKRMMYITNTVGDGEFTADETPHLAAVPFYFGSLSDLTIDGGGSTFIIDGRATNMALENCRNVTIKNLELRHAHPDMHELRVVGKTLFSVDFELDGDTQYEFDGDKLVFYGNGYRTRADKDALIASWIGLIREATPDKVERVRHPLFSAIKIRNIGDRRVRVTYPNTSRFKKGDRFYVYYVRRQFAGIFVNKCDNTALDNIKQRFNYSLALVAQDCENITVTSSEFAPEEGSVRKLASCADFIQLCMCRGTVKVSGCHFDGAGDDLLNVHGIHFKITDICGNEMTVRFIHPQTHGFDPLRVGDEIAYIDPDTLLQIGTAVIESSALINEYEIRLKVSGTAGAKAGVAIEDISACPGLEFTGNTSTRIITRGLLITTRGRVNVESNRFRSTSMSGILLSDDAKSWYESGMCCDVTIKDNVFDYCGETPILIKPENGKYGGAVHKNIKIIGNTFKKYSGACISAKAADGLTIKGNRFANGVKPKLVNCENVWKTEE